MFRGGYNHQVFTLSQLLTCVWELEGELAQEKTQAFSIVEKEALEVWLVDAKTSLTAL